MDQTQKDAALSAAIDAFFRNRIFRDENGRARLTHYAGTVACWRALWDAHDFSWGGLADAGWERGDHANDAEKRKRWEAPADFPLVVGHEGLSAQFFQRATLQDYWRWIPADGWSVDQGWAGDVLQAMRNSKTWAFWSRWRDAFGMLCIARIYGLRLHQT